MDVEEAHSHGPGGGALSLEEDVCPPELLMTCESSKASRPVFLVLQSTPLILQEPCEQLASICGAATEHPVVKAYLLLCPSPIFPMAGLFFTVIFLIAGTGSKKMRELRKMDRSLL